MKTFGAMALMCGSFVLGAWLDGQGQLDELKDQADLGDAQRAAKHAYRKELRAAQLCREELGAGTTIQWTADGELVCIPKTRK